MDKKEILLNETMDKVNRRKGTGELSDRQIQKLSDISMKFCQEMTGVDLYPYEEELSWRIIYSLLVEDADEISALFARQCLQENTKIIRNDGKEIEIRDLNVGDSVLTPDGNGERIIRTSWGIGDLFEVIPEEREFERYRVTDNHILSLIRKQSGSVEDICMNAFIDGKERIENFFGYARRMGKLFLTDLSLRMKGKGKWAGIVLDGQGRCFLRDRTVTHNSGKCFGEGTPVRLANGEIKAIEEIEEGDLIKGTNYRDLKVNGLATGKEEMFRISPHGVADPYIVNKSHILTLWDRKYCEIVDIPLTEVLPEIQRYNGLRQCGKGAYEQYGFSILDYGKGEYFGFSVEGDHKRFFLRDGTVVHNTETVAVTVCGCCVLFPELAKALKSDRRINKFKNGLWCGIFGPIYDQAGTMWARMRARMYSDSSKQMLLDPDINIDLSGESENMVLPNGSFVDCKTASPQAKIEGKTYHLMLLEECLGPNSTLETEDGFMTIKYIVERKYKGKVKAWDHESEKVVWAEILGYMSRSGGSGFRVRVNEYDYLDCTRNHRWFLDGIGYERTDDIFFNSDWNLQNYPVEGKWKPIEFLRVDGKKIKPHYISVIELRKVYDIKTSTGNFFVNGILSHNCQDISAHKIRASLHPMMASTAGTIVKIGTPNKEKSEFYETCRRNKRFDIVEGNSNSRKRNHFEFDYTVAQRYNPRYRKYIAKEKRRLGEDSEDFRMKYKLHWLLSRGMFVDPDVFEERGIRRTDTLEAKKVIGSNVKIIKFVRSNKLVKYDDKNEHYAAIDVGRENSTVITVGRPFWDGGIDYDNDKRYPIHVSNWLELQGDDHEAQHPQILEFLMNYKLGTVIIDATGKGDPVYSRIAAALDTLGIFVMPFVFSESSKDVGYKVFLQELQSGRFTFPAGKNATKTQVYIKFHQQMTDLEKRWRGQKMVVKKPEGDEARDDFCDSGMLLCYAVNVSGEMEVDSKPNPFFGRDARWMKADMMKQMGANYRRGIEPPGRNNGRRRTKWD